MKKIITITLLALITSCSSITTTQNVVETQSVNSIEIERLMGPVDLGLHKIQLNDTTTILIYRGVESCTMIQLK